METSRSPSKATASAFGSRPLFEVGAMSIHPLLQVIEVVFMASVIAWVFAVLTWRRTLAHRALVCLLSSVALLIVLRAPLPRDNACCRLRSRYRLPRNRATPSWNHVQVDDGSISIETTSTATSSFRADICHVYPGFSSGCQNGIVASFLFCDPELVGTHRNRGGGVVTIQLARSKCACPWEK